MQFFKCYKFSFLTALVIACALLAACASQTKTADTGLRPAWPAPPDAPRIIHMKSFSSPEELNITKGFFTRVYEFIVGPSNLRLIRPMSVVVATDKTIFVADPGSHGIHRFDISHNKHILIQQEDQQPLPSPIGLAIDTNNNVYISDSALSKIFIIKPGSDIAEPLSLSTALQQPTGVATDAEGSRLYVSDTAIHQVKVFAPDGKLINTIGHRGSSSGEFNFPTYIWLARNGQLYVTDSMNFRIQIFDGEGNFTGQFGRHGNGTGDMSNPKGIATDTYEHVYVTDSMHHALQIFNMSGDLLLNIGSRGRGDGEFWLPAGAFMTSDNHLYVADSYNQRIQVFHYTGGKQ